MEMTGEQLVPAPQAEVWRALNDPEVLKQCVPGCESIEPTGDNAYQVLMVARVGPVSAKFKGKLTLSDVKAPDSYSLAFEGQGGAAGFAKGSAKVSLSSPGHDQTRLAYDVHANVGGKLAQIGSRLVDAAAKKVADDFFRAFNEKLSHRGGEEAGHDDHPAPVPRDADLPQASDPTVMFFAAGSLVVYFVSLVALLG
ncbi:MAG: carbon monoxide dehydrogenase subunit G [Betaproteobacteria bacterium]|nr:carbon monoxide dehydrogenase subunit G [Betaproteobacteria bacterium]